MSVWSTMIYSLRKMKSYIDSKIDSVQSEVKDTITAEIGEIKTDLSVSGQLSDRYGKVVTARGFNTTDVSTFISSVKYSNGRMGSVYLTNNQTITGYNFQGLYNYIWTPNQDGANHSQAVGKNLDYGNLILYRLRDGAGHANGYLIYCHQPVDDTLYTEDNNQITTEDSTAIGMQEYLEAREFAFTDEINNLVSDIEVRDMTLKITKSDGTSSILQLNSPVYENMVGATAETAGARGLVPGPAAGDQEKFLRGDGTWEVVPTSVTEIEEEDGGVIKQNVSGTTLSYTYWPGSLTVEKSDGSHKEISDYLSRIVLKGEVGTEKLLGLVKLYTNTGSNTDGTVTQALFTQRINDLTSKYNSFNDAKGEIVSSALGTALALTSNNTWSEIITKLEGVENRGKYVTSVGIDTSVSSGAGYYSNVKVNGPVSQHVSITLSDSQTGTSNFDQNLAINKLSINASNVYNKGKNDGYAAGHKGSAVESDVLSGKTFSNDSSVGISGTRVDLGSEPQMNGGTLYNGEVFLYPVANGDQRNYAFQRGVHASPDNIAKWGGTGGAFEANNYTKDGLVGGQYYHIHFPAGWYKDWSGQGWAPEIRIPVSSAPNTQIYKDGYAQGVTDADNRTNVDSANYKAGYTDGHNAPKTGTISLRVKTWSYDDPAVKRVVQVYINGSLVFDWTGGFTEDKEDTSTHSVTI